MMRNWQLDGRSCQSIINGGKYFSTVLCLTGFKPLRNACSCEHPACLASFTSQYSQVCFHSHTNRPIYGELEKMAIQTSYLLWHDIRTYDEYPSN